MMKKIALIGLAATMLAGCSPNSNDMSSPALDTNRARSTMRQNTNAVPPESAPAPGSPTAK